MFRFAAAKTQRANGNAVTTPTQSIPQQAPRRESERFENSATFRVRCRKICSVARLRPAVAAGSDFKSKITRRKRSSSRDSEQIRRYCAGIVLNAP
jgi:hypothetical protein